jgi:hypothetical protein
MAEDVTHSGLSLAKIKDLLVICLIPFAGWVWTMSSDVDALQRTVESLERTRQKFEGQIEGLKAQDVEFKIINARIDARLNQIDTNIAEIKTLLKEKLR